MKDYKETLAKLKQSHSDLKTELELARLDIVHLVSAECLKIHKVKKGSIIKEDNGTGDLVKVAAVFPKEDQSRQPGIKGVKKKMNGEWGVREINVWAWNSNWVLISE
jgi:hypothetical protein